MKRIISIRTNQMWILGILLVCVYSINSFAITELSTHASYARTTDSIVKVLASDCVSCSPDIAPGGPLAGNKSAALVALVSSKALSQEEASFQSYLNVYCMTYTSLGGVNNFKKKLIEPMKTTAANDETMNRYWSTPGCEPQRIGGTMSPLVHLAAENPTDRKAYLVALQKFYTDKGDKTTFTKILNAKNTRGQTLLDYMNYLYLEKDYMKEEEKPLNDLYKFLCENGAMFSTYNKKCPAEYLSI